MKTKNILLNAFLFILVVLFTACPKPQDTINKQYTIKGKLVYSCDNPIPVKNASIDFELSGFYPTIQTIATSTTDNNGNFSYSYSTLPNTNSPNAGIGMGIAAGFAYNEIIWFNINSDIDAGNVYSKNNYFFIVKIATDSAYTSNDTLIDLSNGVYHPTYIVGPFYSGQILDTMNESMPVDFNHPENNGILLTWKFPNITSSVKYSPFSNSIQCMRYNVVTLQLHK